MSERMDLADLLAREGYADTDLPRLLAWARARADALLAGTDVPAPLRQLFDGAAPSSERAAASASASSGHVPKDIHEAPARAPAPAPALEEDIPIDLRRAVTAATAPHPAAVEDDADSGIGGFARFGGLGRIKNKPYPFRQESEPEDRPTMARSFAIAAEKAAEERVPSLARAPSATSNTELSGTLPMAALAMSAEESGGLVLGIPDDDAADVPVSRASTPSAASPRAAQPVRSGAPVDDDDEPPPPAPSRPLAATDDESESALGGLIEATDSELLAVSDVLTEAPGDDPLPPPPSPVITEPSGVDLSRPIIARETNPVLQSVRETTGPRDAHDADHHDDPQAPVLRRRNAPAPKKKVVELGAPVVRPRGASGGAVTPKSPPAPRKLPPPPPPPGARRPTPRHEEIEELSRVEVLDDLPAYLRDDEE